MVAVIGAGIIAVMILVAVCTLSFTRYGPDDPGRRHQLLALAVGSVTLAGGLALGLCAALFLRTYEPEPYYGSFYAPVFTCLAAAVISLVGLVVGAVVLFRLWRAGRAP